MIDIHSSAVSLLLITSVLISRLTVNLQVGIARLVYVIANHTIRTAIMLL